MQKIIKRTLALLLAVMLCLGAMPFSAFASEMPSDDTVSSEAPSSEAPEESGQPDESIDSSAAPEESQPVPDPDLPDEPAEAQEEDTADTAEPTTGPDDLGLTPGTELDVNRVWPALRRAQVRAAASYGTSGTLYVGDYCFTESVGTLPTLGESIGLTPIETMRYGSNNVAAYCLEHLKESGDGMGYTCNAGKP